MILYREFTLYPSLATIANHQYWYMDNAFRNEAIFDDGIYFPDFDYVYGYSLIIEHLWGELPHNDSLS